MRLVTRSDFDGLACAALLKHLGLIDEYKFAHPKDIQDGIVEINSNDILANVPYHPSAGIWFDHHSSELERIGDTKYVGLSKPLPSCARVIWEYYGGKDKFPGRFDDMMSAVDKVDSGNLTKEEIENPQGWILLGFIMDPRTGLGRYHDYRISNHQLMLDMVDCCETMSAAEILAIPDVHERVNRYFEQDKLFKKMIQENSKVYGRLLVTDLRNTPEIYTGNRFVVYSEFPDCNISMQVMWGFKKQNVVFTLGHSILNRSSKVNVGSLMLQFGGGGHDKVGTCQVPVEQAEEALKSLITTINTTDK
ncbi:exopolyphosphatase [Desulfovibrio litoralis]|uniref:NanoRNase/pAp phosphatase, hydrolyzes c-di-AMP and oligoRNAs n=1 Tax=Desulfovibrio litoralis DSM 11393 TaxID=1121455 RepID=A0A1M7SRM8_9BACT|nr:exopolyphosphatase [Desulfovibrio litoralis]SHN61040.1 nanoRNase/pAp phosphatase, hydrolyzes c-di-AMP and oligoRNAs [Desulfovibrio litoralis DSM 11393]